MLLAGAPWRRAIGKMLLAGGAVTELLLAGALQRRAIGKMLLAGRRGGAPSGSCCCPEFPAGRPCGSSGTQLRRVTI
ncbi:MAG: hypothetical protein PUC92_06955 [bacterium]|nr:hypothetical protein [bacterium]